MSLHWSGQLPALVFHCTSSMVNLGVTLALATRFVRLTPELRHRNSCSTLCSGRQVRRSRHGALTDVSACFNTASARSLCSWWHYMAIRLYRALSYHSTLQVHQIRTATSTGAQIEVRVRYCSNTETCCPRTYRRQRCQIISPEVWVTSNTSLSQLNGLSLPFRLCH